MYDASYKEPYAFEPSTPIAAAIVSTIPVIVIAYILGVFFTAVMELVLTKIFHIKTFSNDVIIKVSQSNNDLLIQKYKEADRNIKLLNGSSLAFFTLGLAFFNFHITLGVILFPIGIIAAILCPIVAISIRNQFYELSGKHFESV